MPTFHALQRELGDRVQFNGVYITEAHAVDEWPISSSRANAQRGPVHIKQATSNSERCQAARNFVKDFDFQVPMLVDTIDNEFDRSYAPWPLRFYVFHGGKVEYIAEPRDGRFDVAELREALLSSLRD